MTPEHRLEIRLYGVAPRDCILTDWQIYIENRERVLCGYQESDFIVLQPRYGGNYQLPRSEYADE